MNTKEFFVILLRVADADTLEALLAAPGLRFLYPVSGLVWVRYIGGGLADYNGTKVTFDPNKIKGAKFLTTTDLLEQLKEALVEPITSEELSELREDLIRDTNSPEEDFHPPDLVIDQQPLKKGLI